LGWLMCQTGRYPAAQDYFNQALENANYAGRSKTLLTKGICYHRSGDTANAEVYLVKAYELDVTNAVTGFNLAKVLYINKKYDLAASYIHRVNLLPQSNAETLWLEIQLAKKIGQSTLMQELMVQLKKRYPQSAQMGLLDKGVFDD
jgi:type IV pilus assembly protein PilF